MAKKYNHVHRYEKVVLGNKGYTVFKCNLPDCQHYLRAELAKGKQTICNRCGNEMILDNRAMKLVRPHCVDCIKTAKKDTHDSILEFIQAHDFPAKQS